jgi:ATP-dependent Clp protease protease subunit
MNGFRMQADGGKGEIWIFGLISSFFFEDGVSSDEFIKELRDLGDVSELVVHINSPGGHVHEGQAIYNALKEHPANVVTSIEGAAWSAASMIAMAGDTIRMHANSTLMIHEPLGGGWGFAADLRKIANELEQLSGVVLDVYTARSGADRDQVAAWMKEEKSFTAQAAKDAGFVDEIVANKGKSKSTASASRPAVNWSQQLKTLGVRGLPQVALALSKETNPESQAMSASTTPASTPAATAEQTPAAPVNQSQQAQPPASPTVTTAPVAQQPSADEVRAAERKRISGITAVCEMAKVDPAKRQKFIDDGTSLDDVTIAARQQMAASNPPPEASKGGETQGEGDPAAKYRAEYKARGAKFNQSSPITEDEYVQSRMIDDGHEPLVNLKQKKAAAAA